MNVQRLRSAISIISDEQVILSTRQVTYLRTYPALVALARTPDVDPKTRFFQLTAAAYGWMPRVLRLDTEYLDAALNVLEAAIQVKEFTGDSAIIGPLADCLSSVVGASKVLHFTLPDAYPIWDTKVQRVWERTDPTQHYMSQPRNYIKYAEDVHRIHSSKAFAETVQDLRNAQSARLARLEIPPYPMSDIRIIESTAFELSGGEYEGD